MPYLLSEEALDPGLAQVYNDLMSNEGHGNTYSMRVPAGFRHGTFGDCQNEFGRRFGATLLAMRDDAAGLVVNPAWDSPVAHGSVLYYVAGERVDVSQLAIGAR